MLKINKSGLFKEMLVEKEDLTVQELKGLLQSHLGDKSSTELFQNLMCARKGKMKIHSKFFIVSLAFNKRSSLLPNTALLI